MGKRSKIIKAVKADPKRFMYKGCCGFEARGADTTNSGEVKPCGWPIYSHRNLVRSVLRKLHYIPKTKAKAPV